MSVVNGWLMCIICYQFIICISKQNKFSGCQSAVIRKTNLLLVFGWKNVFCSSFTAPVSYEQSDTSRQPFKCDFPSVIHSKHAVDEKNVMFTEVTSLWWSWWQMKNWHHSWEHGHKGQRHEALASHQWWFVNIHRRIVTSGAVKCNHLW